MRIFKNLTIVFIAVLLFGSCSKGELIEKDSRLEKDKASIMLINAETGKEQAFSSEAEMLKSVEGESFYSDLKKKVDFIDVESRYIEMNELISKDENDPEVKEYLSKYENNLKSLAHGILYTGFDRTGEPLAYTFAANPSMKKSNRNKASSWVCITGGTIVLCDRTWFRTPRKYIVSSPGYTWNLYDFDNKTESFF